MAVDIYDLVEETLKGNPAKTQMLCDLFLMDEKSRYLLSKEQLRTLQEFYQPQIQHEFEKNPNHPTAALLLGLFNQYLSANKSWFARFRAQRAMMRYYQKAVSQNNPFAMTLLANIYLSSKRSPRRDLAIQLLDNAIGLNNPSAMYLGAMYFLAKGLPYTHVLSTPSLLMNASNTHHHALSMCKLGDLFRTGVLQDNVPLEKAVYWYDKAIALNCPQAMLKKANLLLQPEQPANSAIVEAARLYRRAYAEGQGFADIVTIANRGGIFKTLYDACEVDHPCHFEVSYHYAMAVKKYSEVNVLCGNSAKRIITTINEDRLLSATERSDLIYYLVKNNPKLNNQFHVPLPESYLQVLSYAKKKKNAGAFFEAKLTTFVEQGVPQEVVSSFEQALRVYNEALDKGNSFAQAFEEAKPFHEQVFKAAIVDSSTTTATQSFYRLHASSYVCREYKALEDATINKLEEASRFLGDGRKGDAKRGKSADLFLCNLDRFLATKESPVEQLIAIDQLAKVIIENKNQLYTRRNERYKLGLFLAIRNDVRLSGTQLAHLRILQEKYVGIVLDNLGDRMVREAAIRQREGIVDFSLTYYEKKIQRVTEARKIIDQSVARYLQVFQVDESRQPRPNMSFSA